jgi:uncharacterized membrane protein YphA (DoxX/SURF4 family)
VTAQRQAVIGSPWVAGLALRAALASPFLASGLMKLFGWPGAVAEFTRLGIPFPRLAVAAVIITQLAGSWLLLGSRQAWLGAGILAAFTAVATVIAHPFWSFEGADRTRQLTTFFEHLAIIGGLAAAALLAARTPDRLAEGGRRS